MLNEQDLVPYTCTPLRGERLLVLAPHPDDEVIGCGGLVALHALEKRHVRVVVATDGAEADPAAGDDYRSRREQESIDALRSLGVESDPIFLRMPDRALSSRQEDLRGSIRDLIERERPDLILVPSPVEVHPDHVALCRALFGLVHEDDSLRGLLAVASVAFYEVSQPIQPNILVDVTSVLDARTAAVKAHESQQSLRDYAGFQLGLSRYRAVTLPAGVEAAEAYHLETAEALRAITWRELCARVSPQVQPFVEVTGGDVAVTVVIRTRNREAWLREAVESVLANDHRASIVVVNDGGQSPAGWLAGVSPDVVLIDHAESRGRSSAMNAGVERASTEWVAFLDDDDVYYPEHLATLAAAAATGVARAYYTDAVYARMEKGEDGRWIATTHTRVFQQDFDPHLLLVDNYIPLPTLLVRRDDYLAAGGFDPAIDMFEDWDFLIRLSRLGPLQRIPRVTCEVRQFPTSGSPVLAAPEGSRAYLESKAIVWRKHRDRLTAEAFEAQKRRLVTHATRALELEGQVRRIQSDLDRLEREKRLLIDELGKEAARTSDARAAFDGYRVEAEARIDRIDAAREAVQRQLDRAVAERDAKNGECESLRVLLDQHREAVAAQTATITALYAEIDRLNGVVAHTSTVLEKLRASFAWKLHAAMQRIKGRG